MVTRPYAEGDSWVKPAIINQPLPGWSDAPQWQSEPPTEPGWYRVWTGCEKVFEFDGVFFWTTSGNYEPDGHGGWLYDHRKIDFLPPPEGS